jgi:hypothetical protein
LLRGWKRILDPAQASLPLSRLSRNLALGTPAPNEDWTAVYAAGLRAVVDFAADSGDHGAAVREHGLRYLHLPVAPGDIPRIDEVHIVSSWVLQRICEDGPVLLREAQPLGTAASIAIAVLLKRGVEMNRALARLRKLPGVALSDGHLTLLQRFALEAAHVPLRR